MVPIYLFAIPPSVGISPRETEKLNAHIKKLLYGSMIFTIRELTEAGQDIWPASLLNDCQDKDCLVKFA